MADVGHLHREGENTRAYHMAIFEDLDVSADCFIVCMDASLVCDFLTSCFRTNIYCLNSSIYSDHHSNFGECF
eukprot:c3051_g1_i1 orf=120-338(+)